MKSLFSIITLALLTALPVRGEVVDSLQIYVQAGDSCMQQFNTFEHATCWLCSRNAIFFVIGYERVWNLRDLRSEIESET